LLTASSLAWLDVRRALRRGGQSDVRSTTQQALAGVAEFPLSDTILVRARHIDTDNLPLLDAIHLASAVAVGADSMLSYDNRLAASAAAAGIVVLSPTMRGAGTGGVHYGDVWLAAPRHQAVGSWQAPCMNLRRDKDRQDSFLS